MPNFADFGLLPTILDAVATEGYTAPTPIQSQAIPFVLAGRDLCGIAQTGTGKTAAFALPILHRLSNRPAAAPRGACRVLVLSPTRELASQIAESFRSYGRRLPLFTAVVFGGVPLGAQQRRLASGVDILVATPGRLLDLIDRRALVLSNVEILVLDEADRMLDLGFIHALKRIVKLVPRRRQTLLFSATMPPTIAALAEDYLRACRRIIESPWEYANLGTAAVPAACGPEARGPNRAVIPERALSDPVKVAVAPSATTAERVEQGVIFVASERKRDLLTTLLHDPSFERVLVFTRTKHGADRVARHLAGAGIEAAAIHGNKSQPQRERALAGFRSGDGRVLVATDIAARGIDVDGVSHVINFELPNVPEDYVHRIGRTARAGAGGTAIAFCSDEERPYLRGIEKLTRLSVPVVAMPSAARDSRGGAIIRHQLHQKAGSSPPAARGAGIAAETPKPPSGAKVDRDKAEAGSSPLPAFLRRHSSAKRTPAVHQSARHPRRKVATR